MHKFEHLPTDPYARPKPEPAVAFTVVVSSGVTSSGLTQTSIEFEQVLSGGIAISNTVDSGGLVTVNGGGVTMGDVVSSGGAEVLSAGAIASNTTVSANGIISGAGQIDNASIYGFAAGLKVGPTNEIFSENYIESGGVASGLAVMKNAVLSVDVSGTAMATSVSGGGFMVIGSGGVASGSIILSGGGLAVIGGEADTARLSAGAYAFVSGTTAVSGGSVVAATLNSATILGGFVEIASSGEATAAQIYSGATVQVDAAGELSSSTLRGGTLSVGFAGEVSSLTIAEGGKAILLRNGQASTVDVASGTLSLDPFAIGAAVTVAAGGVLIDNGAVEDGSGADQTKAVLAGQLSGSGLLLLAGGALDLAGTTSAFTGELVIDGGTAELASMDGVNHGSVDFYVYATSASETLQIDAANRPATGTAYGAAIIDFSSSTNRIDLAGLAYVSGATAKVTGDTLTLVDGGYRASFTLSHSRARDYGVVSDGAGGTTIRGSLGAPIPLVEAAAVFATKDVSAGLSSATETRGAELNLALRTADGPLRHASS